MQGEGVSASSSDVAVCVPLFLDPKLSQHWFHHGLQPAAAAAVAIRTSVAAPSNSNAGLLRLSHDALCTVVAPSRLVSVLQSNAMVRFLFETVLSQGRFRIAGYVAGDSRASITHSATRRGCIGQDWTEANLSTVVGTRFPAVNYELRSARPAFWRVCGLDAMPASRPLMRDGRYAPMRRVLVYERDANRHVANLEAVLAALRALIGADGSVRLVHHEPTRTPCELVRAVAEADLLVSVHGFNSALLLFLRRGAGFVEIFPRGYAWPQDAISRVAPYLGVRHAHVYGTPQAPSLWKAPGPAFLARTLDGLPEWATSRSSFVAMLHRTGRRMHDLHVNTSALGIAVRALASRNATRVGRRDAFVRLLPARLGRTHTTKAGQIRWNAEDARRQRLR